MTRGIEQNGIGESRQEPVAGRDLKVSLDVNIQAYCQQAAERRWQKNRRTASRFFL